MKGTPKRRRRLPQKTPEPSHTSTPLHKGRLLNICATCSEAEDGQDKPSEVESPRYMSRSQSRKRSIEVAKPRQLRKRLPLIQTTCSPAKRRCSKKQKKGTVTASSSEPSRPTFELEEDESLLSSDLSIEISDHKEQLSPVSFLEDEESVDEEELPSFLMQTRPLSITEGVFVWCKFRRFPIWPALVKRVNCKAKKASIIFIDDLKIGQKRGVIVALKSLKPFDCEGANELASEAKEEYATVMQWSLELIKDYTICIACGSFSGSFLEYFAHGMSYPVRRKYPKASSEQLTITSDVMIEEENQWIDHNEDCDQQEEASSEQLTIASDLMIEEEGRLVNVNEDSGQQEEANKCVKRLMPDRTQAAHNRANEKLVDFIVKQRMVEERLLAVIRGKAQSRWLNYFQNSKRRFIGVETYLEDNTQLDKMYSYLNELYKTAVSTDPCQTAVQYMERIPFVLDVLLPEAITYAIAGIDNVSIKKAEEKYLKGRCLSNREREEYELMIDQLRMRKS
ncbi:PWWP domain-containing DNA repair factor 3A [Phyllopteryx taeniolatus]|uniref:PWWP domain-containing DNA repair factor 3A n=1 Tax=Phyllopteryx taeniolatus TaxID=161469 RepID=UPI002AD2BDE7|nr:PWWP domain-containing DNA repair factor 3A [Phyllopteryx taeniolatus]XP_061621814.1 PWWP domain-containing DNA repair factor 3A [Phyllopteryx taeniolatus]XP_061621815.1 PWWP domain-containing DNA repair factor 3A [Phyllopteryx taeniolatus]XP_061621816.1 PWWP domain-containing DNA repair factor 3A [Phyllopteryx taeniolatus]XP_061621817.1 PWWP domain-containing DNA repair factor 3A [Phyllopteryx taeniolatus]XP_061621818.1 PWWP domain-containing DNA repair factor 3A [Phyllopteryx taeniolatus]